ncbi:F-box protein-like protein [Tanacetum coccineum]
MKTIGEPLVRSEVAAGYGDDGTASKKLITDTGDSELKLSVHSVMSNEDILIEILLRLPVISLLPFKVISKHWLSVITSPNFTSRLSRIPSMAPACGRKVILDSCNGLLLFRSGYYPVYWNDAIHWLNVSSEMPLHAMLDVVDNTVLTTKLPRPLDKRVPCDHKFFRSRGYLLLICKEYFYTRKLLVYEMRNWDSGWFVKYFINLDDVIMNTFPNDDWSIGGCVWCYVTSFFGLVVICFLFVRSTFIPESCLFTGWGIGILGGL